MTAPTASLYLRRGSIEQLAALAARRNYLQTRGRGRGTAPSASAFIDALAVGELVAIGPFGAWRQVVTALTVAEAVVSPEAAALLATIRQQVEAEADFSSDDTE